MSDESKHVTPNAPRQLSTKMIGLSSLFGRRRYSLTPEEASHILRGYYPHLPPDPCAVCRSIHDKLVQIRDGESA